MKGRVTHRSDNCDLDVHIAIAVKVCDMDLHICASRIGKADLCKIWAREHLCLGRIVGMNNHNQDMTIAVHAHDLRRLLLTVATSKHATYDLTVCWAVGAGIGEMGLEPGFTYCTDKTVKKD